MDPQVVAILSRVQERINSERLAQVIKLKDEPKELVAALKEALDDGSFANDLKSGIGEVSQAEKSLILKKLLGLAYYYPSLYTSITRASASLLHR